MRSVAVAVALLVVTVSPALAYDPTDDAWGQREHGWVPRERNGYRYEIPVCLGAGMGSTTWNLLFSRQARLNDAMNEWNSIGGELRFFRGGWSCADYEAAGQPYVKVNVLSNTPTEALGYAEMRTTLCWEHWGFNCHNRAEIWIDASYPLWWSSNPDVPSGYQDGLTVWLHELGHTIHLSHVDGPTDNLMYCCGVALGRRVHVGGDPAIGYTHYYGWTH